MRTRKTFKSGYFKYFIGLIVLASVGMYFFIQHLNQKSLENLREKECLGIITSMDHSSGSVVFHLNDSSISLGKIGRKISLNATAGDSLIKNAGSDFVYLVKMKDSSPKRDTFQIF